MYLTHLWEDLPCAIPVLDGYPPLFHPGTHTCGSCDHQEFFFINFFFIKHTTDTEKQRSSLMRTKGSDDFKKEEIFLTFTNILCTVKQRVLNDLYWVRLSRGCIIWLLAHPHPLPPLPSVSSTGDTQEDWERQKTWWQGWRWRGWARSRIIWPQESLVLYKSFNAAWFIIIAVAQPWESSPGIGGPVLADRHTKNLATPFPTVLIYTVPYST